MLFVTDLDRSIRFYEEVFGFKLVSREDKMNAAFFRATDSANHHDLGLFGLGRGAPPAQRGRAGLYHLAWQVDTIDELVEMRTRVVESGAYGGESSHGATKSIYGTDPDGNEFEVMWLLPRHAWGEYETKAVVERLDLAADVATWSGVPTAHETA